MANITIKNLKRALSFSDRLFGLINPSNPRTLLLSTHFGIHTFFLHVPIDVLILDDEYRVVKIKHNLQPYSFYFYHPRFHLVLEMPSGSITTLNVHINDKIFIA